MSVPWAGRKGSIQEQTCDCGEPPLLPSYLGVSKAIDYIAWHKATAIPDIATDRFRWARKTLLRPMWIHALADLVNIVFADHTSSHSVVDIAIDLRTASRRVDI